MAHLSVRFVEETDLTFFMLRISWVQTKAPQLSLWGDLVIQVRFLREILRSAHQAQIFLRVALRSIFVRGSRCTPIGSGTSFLRGCPEINLSRPRLCSLHCLRYHFTADTETLNMWATSVRVAPCFTALTTLPLKSWECNFMIEETF